MVVLTSLSQPTEGIRHQQQNTTAHLNQTNLGNGTLYIAERSGFNNFAQLTDRNSTEVTLINFLQSTLVG